MKTFFLLVIIAIFGTFIFLKVQVLGDPNSNFNKTTRYTLGKNELVRKILGMHSYGDARNAYLEKTGGIVVELVHSKGTDIPELPVSKFIEDIKTYTGKNVKLYDTEFIPSGTYDENGLNEIVSGYRHHIVSGQTNLFIVYATDFKRSGGELAKTFKEFGIVLSDKRLREFASNQPVSLNQYIESTLLHEFGHQLGLEHNNEANCIMNEKVESPSSSNIFSGIFTPTQFCNFELKQLEAIKSKLQ